MSEPTCLLLHTAYAGYKKWCGLWDRLDEEKAARLQAQHEAEQAGKARDRAEARELQRLRTLSILDQQVRPDFKRPDALLCVAAGDQKVLLWLFTRPVEGSSPPEAHQWQMILLHRLITLMRTMQVPLWRWV